VFTIWLTHFIDWLREFSYRNDSIVYTKCSNVNRKYLYMNRIFHCFILVTAVTLSV